VALYIPQTHPETVTAAYGKLPADITPWALVIRGPIMYGQLREPLMGRGYAPIKPSIMEAYALRRKRLTWLTWVPSLGEYAGFLAGGLVESKPARIGLPMFGLALAQGLKYIPAQATQEKLERLQRDMCPVEGRVDDGEVKECVIFTISGPPPVVFRFIVLPRGPQGLSIIPEQEGDNNGDGR